MARLSSTFLYLAVITLIISAKTSTTSPNGKCLSCDASDSLALWIYWLMPYAFVCTLIYTFVNTVWMSYWHLCYLRRSKEQVLMICSQGCLFLQSLIVCLEYYSVPYSVSSLLLHFLLETMFPVIGVLFHYLTLQFLKRLPKDDTTVTSLATQRVPLHFPLSYYMQTTHVCLDAETIYQINMLVLAPIFFSIGVFGVNMVLHNFSLEVYHCLYVPPMIAVHVLSHFASHLLYKAVSKELKVAHFHSKVRFVSTLMLLAGIQDVVGPVLMDLKWFNHAYWSLMLTLEACIASLLMARVFNAKEYGVKSRG